MAVGVVALRQEKMLDMVLERSNNVRVSIQEPVDRLGVPAPCVRPVGRTRT